MARDGLIARLDPTREGEAVLSKRQAGASLGAGRASLPALRRAAALGLLVQQASGRFEPAPQDGAATGREAAGGSPRLNEAESPLLWLHRRRGADGRPLLDEAAFLAGERFRRDVTQAAMLPSVTTNWSRMETAGASASPRDPALASDVAIGARQRVRAAFAVLGSEIGHFVLDVCGFLVPLQEAELRRSWPPRSGKLVLRLALGRLARHYGIAEAATGPDAARPRAWSDGERSGFSEWLDPPAR